MPIGGKENLPFNLPKCYDIATQTCENTLLTPSLQGQLALDGG